MRIAAIYDVHGNLPALEAVLADVKRAGVDGVVVGGDVVPGPMPEETIDALLALEVPARFIRGNGEREVLALLAGAAPKRIPAPYVYVMRWVAQNVRPEQARVLASWPETLETDIAGIGTVLFCHATPESDEAVFTRATPERHLPASLASAGVPLVVCGHTHMQFDRTVAGVRVVNAGSVGMPFGEPGAYWLLLDSGVELRRTWYNRTAAAERIRTCGYPQAAEFAEGNVLRPPSEADMNSLFEESVLRG